MTDTLAGLLREALHEAGYAERGPNDTFADLAAAALARRGVLVVDGLTDEQVGHLPGMVYRSAPRVKPEAANRIRAALRRLAEEQG